MRALYLLFALLFLVFQDQARSEDQDEPQEPLTGNSHGLYQSKLTVPVSLSFVNGNLSFLFAEIRSSCFASGGQCRHGLCPWKEMKIASCGFARPCCKKVI
uniref:Beta-defensin-like domain-containing protein n=1 Tax=Chrysemys picta bellii TaxID=8478 RepID=A0A8C3I7F8_CHRPI